MAGLWENTWSLWTAVAIGLGSMGRPACEMTSERVIPVTARARAEPAGGSKEDAKVSLASGLGTIGGGIYLQAA